MKEEIWKPVNGYEGTYEVSNFGNIKRIKHAQGTKGLIILKQRDQGCNLKVELCKDGIQKKHYVHHVVLKAFVGDKPEGLECCHNDGNYKNNHLENLRWDTRSSNVQDAIRHGTFNRPKGEKSHCSKLKNTDILQIRKLLSDGLPQRKIGNMFGVTHSIIGAINRKKHWAHV